jgi:hypothetical protein
MNSTASGFVNHQKWFSSVALHFGTDVRSHRMEADFDVWFGATAENHNLHDSHDSA